MRTVVALCLTIVAAIDGRLAAQSLISEDVAVPGGTRATAAALGIDPPPDRARFVSELARLAYDLPHVRAAGPDVRAERVRAALASVASAAASDAERVPLVPAVAVWGQAVFHRQLSVDTAFAAIIGDRDAALLAYAFAGQDDETIGFFAAHPGLVTQLYQRAAAPFGAFGGSVRIHAGRVVTPGGDAAAPLWEAVVGERVDRPDRFIRDLFEQRDGRIAYLLDTIANIEPRLQAFALGSWIEDPRVRRDRFSALVSVLAEAYKDWRIKMFPYARPLGDFAMLLSRVRADESGRPALPSRTLWTQAFEAGSSREERGPDIDAAWLSEIILTRDLQVRFERLDQFAFGERVFGTAPDADAGAVAEATRAFPKVRALMLSLERIGMSDPAAYVQAAHRAIQLGADADRMATLAQFQGALALVVRMARAGSVTAARAAELVHALVACEPNQNGEYGGAMVAWLDASLGDRGGERGSLEAAILAELAGNADTVAPIVSWEGQRYRLDLAAGERRRLRRVRERQGGATLDAALELHSIAHRLRTDTDHDTVRAAGERLKALAHDLPVRSKPDPGTLPPGVDAPRNARDVVERSLRELAKGSEASRRNSVAAALEQTSDDMAGEALMSLAYAIDIGDADGALLLAGNVATRHDFGFALRDGEGRMRVAWSIAKPDLAPGLPWRLKGSILGLDVGLSSVSLRRINAEHIVGAPSLTSNEREAFAASAAMINAFALRDADRDAIGSAVARGRARVRALASGTLDRVADEVGIDGWRLRAMRWTLSARPSGDTVESLFSARELIRLGGWTPPPTADEWGMSAMNLSGCLCLQLMPPGRWPLWTGRPQLGLMAATVSDLNLHVAEALYEMKLPASLARFVLSAAVQDFIDEVRPTDASDWLTLVRAAQLVSRERIEDYVAAATAADGPLIPEAARGRDRQER